jgi:hypothetical protein
MIRQRKDRDGLQVQVYAGRDPLTGRKRWLSRQVRGQTKTAYRFVRCVCGARACTGWRALVTPGPHMPGIVP